jgi:oxalate---CoA ligase
VQTAETTLAAGSDTSVGGLLADRAVADPGAAAMLSPGRPAVSAEALAARVRELHAVLRERGVGPGDRVAVSAGLGPDAGAAVLAAMSAATCVPVSPTAAPELPEVLTRTRAKALLAPGGAGPLERDAARECGVIVLDGAEGGGAAAATESRDPDEVALILRTSGSTGRPKLVPATHRQLLARANAAAEFLELGPGDRCLCPMPLAYGHGIYTGLLFSLLSGGSVILPESFDEASFRACLELAPTWYTAGAAQHRAILGWLRSGGIGDGARSLRFGRCANGALPPDLQGELEELLGVRVLQTYGTSEAGMISSESPTGPRRKGAAGTPVGVEVKVLNGEVAVRGPTVFSGYEDDPELNRGAFADGWWLSKDHGWLDDQGFLTIGGRLDDVINRGGEKVSPTEVEEALREHPSVAEAVAFAVPHSRLGEDLAAAITAAAGHEPSEPALRAYLSARLAPAKVPRRIAVLPEIPLGPSGKPLRSLAAELAAGPGPAGGGEVSRPTRVEERLAGIWAECLELPGVGPEDDFFELGGDSLAAVELIAAVEQELRVRLEPEDLVQAPTPRLLAGTLAAGSHIDRQEARDLVGVNVTGSRTPLFVIGGRPGYAMRVLLVGRDIDPMQPVYGLQPPFMDWARAGVATLPEMAAHYVSRARSAQPSGPYRILGSSFGGLIAFEMARQLEEAGERVEFVALIDTEPPGFAWRSPTEDMPPHALEDTELPFTAADGPGSDIAAASARVHEAHVQARRAYEIPGPIECEITLFLCSGEGVSAGGDRRRLWADATRGPLRLLALPGLHARFDREPQFSALREALRACLEGSPPPGLDPAEVFDRTYSLEGAGGGEALRDPSGTLLAIERGAMEGRVRELREHRGKLLARGWAGDPASGRPAETVVAFLDGVYAGYSTCGAPTERVARRLNAPGLGHSGFRMRLEPPASKAKPVARFFALGPGGVASELRVSS